jgi:hypothetical protein
MRKSFIEQENDTYFEDTNGYDEDNDAETINR